MSQPSAYETMATASTDEISATGPSAGGELLDREISPTNDTEMALDQDDTEPPAINRDSHNTTTNSSSSTSLASLNMRANPDAQATVTDFLDFTEYLPADMMRSLTLIGKLDQTYTDASSAVHDLTTMWGKLPSLPVDQRQPPVQLRANISTNLNQAVSSRVFAHAEAVRMQQNVNRHYHRARTILSKLQTMRDNYPTTDEPVQPRSPQAVRAPKISLPVDSNGKKIARPPRITVPGEVLAPYEIDFNYSSSSDDSSEDEISVSSPRRSSPAPRIKVVKAPKVQKLKTPKTPRPPRPANAPAGATPNSISTSSALAQLKPPPDDAIAGSSDAPWLQLTAYELAKLRKRMKKNAVWNPSDTMVARELKSLGRGVEAYHTAKKRAEEDGKPFEPEINAQIFETESGLQHPPEGALSIEALSANEIQLSNRGMKLNEAKKLKREALARMAAEEAEEAARQTEQQVKLMMHDGSPQGSGNGQDAKAPGPNTAQAQGKPSSKQKIKKRKRDDSPSESPAAERPEQPPTLSSQHSQSTQLPSQTQTPTPAPQASKPQQKRNKTETPVPPPQLTPRPTSVPPPTETPVPVPQLKTMASGLVSKTPVPVPVTGATPSDSSIVAAKPVPTPPTGTSPAPPTITTNIPTKPPAETPVPPPPKISTTPILPPVRDLPKRETRQNLQLQTAVTNTKQPSSQNSTPSGTPAPELSPIVNGSRRPSSRGKAASQEPTPTLASDRPRRASTARNTPAPEVRQPNKRAKRPAPGIVTTQPGGKSAVGKRKVPPRKKARGGPKKDRGPNAQIEPEIEVEVDDDGNVVDPNEPRYCVCNGVSFGTMIQCDNVDVSKTKATTKKKAKTTATPARSSHKLRNSALTQARKQNCKQEWFHLDCVGLSDVPARTTKWYCPECRVALNIGGRGEVTSRGVRM